MAIITKYHIPHIKKLQQLIIDTDKLYKNVYLYIKTYPIAISIKSRRKTAKTFYGVSYPKQLKIVLNTRTGKSITIEVNSKWNIINKLRNVGLEPTHRLRLRKVRTDTLKVTHSITIIAESENISCDTKLPRDTSLCRKDKDSVALQYDTDATLRQKAFYDMIEKYMIWYTKGNRAKRRCK